MIIDLPPFLSSPRTSVQDAISRIRGASTSSSSESPLPTSTRVRGDSDSVYSNSEAFRSLDSKEAGPPAYEEYETWGGRGIGSARVANPKPVHSTWRTSGGVELERYNSRSGLYSSREREHGAREIEYVEWGVVDDLLKGAGMIAQSEMRARRRKNLWIILTSVLGVLTVSLIVIIVLLTRK